MKSDTYGKIFIAIVILILLLISAYCIYIKNRTSESFDGNNSKFKITLYYTAWCGHSKKVMPEWNKLIELVNSGNVDGLTNKLLIYKIDCDENKEQCQAIRGYPTIVLETPLGEKIMMKHGERTLANILKFIQTNMVINY